MIGSRGSKTLFKPFPSPNCDFGGSQTSMGALHAVVRIYRVLNIFNANAPFKLKHQMPTAVRGTANRSRRLLPSPLLPPDPLSSSPYPHSCLDQLTYSPFPAPTTSAVNIVSNPLMRQLMKQRIFFFLNLKRFTGFYIILWIFCWIKKLSSVIGKELKIV